MLNNIILKDIKIKLVDLHWERDKYADITGDFTAYFSETDSMQTKSYKQLSPPNLTKPLRQANFSRQHRFLLLSNK